MQLNDLITFLNAELTTDRYPANEFGLYRSSERTVRRLGIALEPFDDIGGWTLREQLDALWLHRPWKLDFVTLPPDLGVLYHHLPFDEHLTLGYNPRLATVLGATGLLEPLGYKQATNKAGESLPQRPIGMLFDVVPAPVATYQQRINAEFGGSDRFEMGSRAGADRVAVVGAMNDTLVHVAADRGAHLYVTGQYRPSAQEAVTETGLTVVAIGHRRTEEWGLRALAGLLREQWPNLTVLMPSTDG